MKSRLGRLQFIHLIFGAAGLQCLLKAVPQEEVCLPKNETIYQTEPSSSKATRCHFKYRLSSAEVMILHHTGQHTETIHWFYTLQLYSKELGTLVMIVIIGYYIGDVKLSNCCCISYQGHRTVTSHCLHWGKSLLCIITRTWSHLSKHTDATEHKNYLKIEGGLHAFIRIWVTYGTGGCIQQS